MNKQEKKERLKRIRKSVQKKCTIAKVNIGNDIGNIIRTHFGGTFPLEGKGNPVLKSVSFVPPKQKDQVLHKLVLEKDNILKPGERVTYDMQDFTLEQVVKWYFEVEKKALEQVENETEEEQE